jgi:OOP family OmpA-OmpF porin
VLLATAVVALAVAAALWVQERSRWRSFLTALQNEPGVVVVESGVRGGTRFVNGLRDPLARDPEVVRAEAGLGASRIETRWEPYQALDERFVRARAAALLRPPEGVTLDVADGALRASGRAPAAWIAETQRLAPFVPGIVRLDAAAAIEESLRATGSRLAGVSLRFGNGTTTVLPESEAAVREVSGLLSELAALARLDGRPLRVTVVGHTDDAGGEASNLPLSRARAEAAIARLATAGLAGIEFVAQGVGSTEPASPGLDEADRQRNRRVSFRVSETSATERQP